MRGTRVRHRDGHAADTRVIRLHEHLESRACGDRIIFTRWRKDLHGVVRSVRGYSAWWSFSSSPMKLHGVVRVRLRVRTCIRMGRQEVLGDEVEVRRSTHPPRSSRSRTALFACGI